MPNRVLPVSTSPPVEMQVLINEDMEIAKSLLAGSQRRRSEAEARVRTYMVIEKNLQDLYGDSSRLPSVERLVTQIKRHDWQEFMPMVAGLVQTSPDGIPISLRVSKEGYPIRVDPSSPTAIAFKYVKPEDMWPFLTDGLAGKLGIRRTYFLGLVKMFELKDKDEYHTAIKSGKSSTRLETKPSRWTDTPDMAAQLENSLSCIGPKDWAIWGLPDTGQPPLTSEAGLRIWIDRGELVVNLLMEQDHRFLPFINRLKIASAEFRGYDKLRESLTDFVGTCWAVAHEIWSKAENETGLNLSSIPVVGKGHLLNVPKFVYEFALDNYMSKRLPELEMLQNAPKCYDLVPKTLANYILAVGSRDEMLSCERVVISLSNKYTRDERIGKIRAKTVQIRKEAEPFLTALSTVLREATGDS